MSRKHPNVIVFLTDQQRWDTTGIHGNPLELTPNFDRMAQRGTHVYNSITCQPVCAPARASLQTGLYATRTTVFRNDLALPRDQKTLAHYFGEAGYRTGYIGKWHLADWDPTPRDQQGGYEWWLGANVLEYTSEAYDTVVYDGEGKRVKLPGFRVDALTDAAIRYIDDHQAEPFFLFISYLEPHQQNYLDAHIAPDGYCERYTGRWVPPDLAVLGGLAPAYLGGYFGLVKRLDEALGRLLDALKSLDLSNDTIVLYTSDHGSHFRTRNAAYKRSCHDSSVRVPTAFRGPGFDGGGQVRQLVSLVDLPATLLDAAGLPVPPHMDGRSILPLLRGSCADWPEEVFIQISEAQVARAIRTQRWKYSVYAPDLNGRQAAHSPHYIEQCLYDLYADPYELTNLVGVEDFREVSDMLAARLIRRMVAAGEDAPEITPAPPLPSGPRSPSKPLYPREHPDSPADGPRMR